MEKLSGIITDPAAILSTLQNKGHHTLELIRSHPWSSLGVVTGTVLLWSYIRAPRNLPPGPLGLPLVGAISCYSDNLAEKLLHWRKRYGEVISFYRLGKLHVILNSERSIRDAFAKQGDEFGHRAEETDMAIMGFSDDIFAAPYDDIWKKNKRFSLSTSKNFGFGTVKSESRMQDQLQVFEEFMLKQNGTPTDVSEELKLVCAEVIGTLVLGTRDSWEDSDSAKLMTLITTWDETSNVAFCDLSFWKDFVHPKLAYFMARGICKKIKERADQLNEFLVAKTNKAAVDISEREPQNMIDAYLQERGTSSEVIPPIAHAVMSFLPDAIQGISAVELWCLLHLTLNLELQQQIYKEINTVCGPGRVPSVSDRDKLPSIQALIHEALRTLNPFPLSLQRLLHQDIQFYGFTLPKGTIVAANNYSVQFDPQVFPDPERFLPSRFINQDGTFNTTLGSKVMAFSLGPRKCIGEAFAHQQIYLFMTRMVQRFELRPDPAVPTPTTEKTYEAVFPRPQKFKLCFRPR